MLSQRLKKVVWNRNIKHQTKHVNSFQLAKRKTMKDFVHLPLKGVQLTTNYSNKIVRVKDNATDLVQNSPYRHNLCVSARKRGISNQKRWSRLFEGPLLPQILNIGHNWKFVAFGTCVANVTSKPRGKAIRKRRAQGNERNVFLYRIRFESLFHGEFRPDLDVIFL